VLERIISPAGYGVFAASTGKEGLDLATILQPDAVLLDVGLPDACGFEICSKIRSATPTNDVSIIMVSGESEDYVCERGIAAGANDVLPKPFEPSNVLLKVSNAIQLRQLRQALEDQRNNERNHATELAAIKQRLAENFRTAQHSAALSDFQEDGLEFGQLMDFDRWVPTRRHIA